MGWTTALTAIGTTVAKVGASKLLGGGSKGSSSGGRANTQAYGSNRDSGDGGIMEAAVGLMSKEAANEQEQEDIKVAQAFQGTSPWELRDRVNSWMPKETEDV